MTDFNMLKIIKHDPFPLPMIIEQEVNPVAIYLAKALCIARKETVRVLNGQPEQFVEEMNKLLQQAYNAGIEKGLKTQQKIKEL